MRVLEAERPRQAIVFVRTKIRCEQLYKTLRDKGLNVKALHGDMTQGARDGVMISFKDGRVQILRRHRRRRPRPRHLDRHAHHQLRRPTSPDVYVHRIGRTGRVGRSGRAITFVEPRQRRELEAIERHANTTIAPWTEGAHVAPAPVRERPRRHASRTSAPRRRRARRQAPRARRKGQGLEVADLVHAVTAAAGLDGEAVRNVRVLERFAFLEVPAARGQPRGRGGRRDRGARGAGCV